MTAKEFSYYEIDKIMSLNAQFNFIVGGRGIGKTFGFKRFAIAAALKKGHQFIYLRRFKPELKSRTQFFMDVADFFPDWEFRVNGREAQAAPISTAGDKKREWQVIGFFIALSQAQNEKGGSYKAVRNILFDEFIIEKGHQQYLDDEHHTMLNFYSTIDRNQDKTRVFFMANSVSLSNPYFRNFNIRVREDTDLYRLEGGFIAVHFPNMDDFKGEVYQTRFGRFISGTDFAEFAIESTFEDGHGSMVAYKPNEARYMFTVEGKIGTLHYWKYGEYWWCGVKMKRGDLTVLTTEADKMGEGKSLVAHNERLFARLRGVYKKGKFMFENDEARNVFVKDMFRK